MTKITPVLWAKMEENKSGQYVLSLVFSYHGQYVHMDYGYDGETCDFFAPVDTRAIYPHTICAKAEDIEKYQSYLTQQFPEDVEKASQFLQFSWIEKDN